jgi:phytanoyl-CoA hydroxylase
MIFRRQLYRANVPNATKTTTGVHYDQIFLRGGPATSLTAWLPIGDCTPVQGGLMYLEDSRSLGEELEWEFTTKAREGGLTENETRSAFNQNVSLHREGDAEVADDFYWDGSQGSRSIYQRKGSR